LLFEISIPFNPRAKLQILSSALHRPGLTIPVINRSFQHYLVTNDLLEIYASKGSHERIVDTDTRSYIHRMS
jgi:hypothetical protein